MIVGILALKNNGNQVNQVKLCRQKHRYERASHRNTFCTMFRASMKGVDWQTG